LIRYTIYIIAIWIILRNIYFEINMIINKFLNVNQLWANEKIRYLFQASYVHQCNVTRITNNSCDNRGICSSFSHFCYNNNYVDNIYQILRMSHKWRKACDAMITYVILLSRLSIKLYVWNEYAPAWPSTGKTRSFNLRKSVQGLCLQICGWSRSGR